MKRTLLYSAIVSMLLSCGGSEPPANNTNNSNGNASANKTNASDPLAPTTPTPQQATNNAPTLTPVYKAYCAAYVKKDEAAVRKAYSKETVAFFEKAMKEDNIKSLIAFLSDDGISNEVCEVRNEVISGDTASAEITTKSYPNGFRVVFEKEDGEWKMTNKDPKKQ